MTLLELMEAPGTSAPQMPPADEWIAVSAQWPTLRQLVRVRYSNGHTRKYTRTSDAENWYQQEGCHDITHWQQATQTPEFDETAPEFPRREALEIFDGDDHHWCVNEYWQDEQGTTRRDTIADELTEEQAHAIAAQPCGTKPEPPEDEPDADKAARVAAYEARKAARVERFQERAAKAEREASQRFDNARRQTEGIPFGQPILVGHHSEGRHRAALKRHDQNMDAGCRAMDKAKHYASRADAAASNRAIMSDDPAADEKIAAKIERLEKRQQLMTAANKAIRKGDDAALLELGFDESQIAELKSPGRFGGMGFASYQLTNNGANIRRLKKRLAQVEAAAEVGSSEREEHGVRIVDNVEENRLQLFFPDKPSDEVRKMLKGRGFRWARSAGAWQRHRSTQAKWGAEDVLKLYAAEQE